MATTEGTLKLTQISKAVQEVEHAWRSIEPSAAEELARQYEQRSLLWKKKIELLSSALILVQAVANEGDILGESAAALDSDSDGVAASLKAEGGASVNGPFQGDFEETQKILEECPKIWDEIKRKRSELRNEIDAMVQSQMAQIDTSAETESDWAAVCQKMKHQRDNLRAEIQVAKDRLTMLEDKEAKPVLQKLRDSLASLSEAKQSVKKQIADRQHMEFILEEYHGIIADEASPSHQPQLNEDLTGYLTEEQEAMITYYEAKINRNSRIIDVVAIRRAGSNLIDVTVTPKSDWLEYWRRKKPDHPGLKYVTVTYSKESIFPTNIAVKVNTSTVSEMAFDAVMGPLMQRTQEWKQKMMESPCIDMHGLIRLFL